MRGNGRYYTRLAYRLQLEQCARRPVDSCGLASRAALHATTRTSGPRTPSMRRTMNDSSRSTLRASSATPIRASRASARTSSVRSSSVISAFKRLAAASTASEVGARDLATN